MIPADMTRGLPAAAAAIVAAYLLGAVPFGLLLTRLFVHSDVRDQGSGNIGATNVARVAGKKIGAATLVLDMLKGLLPVLAAKHYFAGTELASAVAAAAVLGHCYPVYLRFRGGKGVATGIGVFAALSPWAALTGALAYLAAFAFTKISAVGSFALLAGVLAVSALSAPPWPPLLAAVLISAVIVYRHGENIRRLMRGTENRF